MLNMIKMDLYRMFRTKSMYVVWIVLAVSVLFTTFLCKTDYDSLSKEDTVRQEQFAEPTAENINVGMMVTLPTEPGEKVTVYDIFFANSQGKFYALFLVIFAVMFSTADIGSGYIKNIGGQVQKRGTLIFSRSIALAVFTVLTMAGAFLLQGAANYIVFKELTWGSYFLTELALHYALVLICMAIAIILKNNVISMVIAICLTMNIMSIVYGLINSAVRKMGIQNFQIYKYTITGKLSLLPMNPSGNECLEAFGVAIVFAVIMIAASSAVFQKRDIYRMYIVIGILAGIIILQFIIMWKYQRQVKDICRQLAFLMKHDSNMLIQREFDLGGIGTLSDRLNELLELQRKEKQRYQEKEALIADTYTNLSHDIRTPLTSLDGYFQLMEECENVEDQRRYLNIIHERIHSLNEMLEELFMFTKLKNESYSLELTPCCINRILKEMVFSYYDDWVRRGIQPDIQITEELLSIAGNKQGLHRVIQNVIKNGLDHGEKKISIVLERKQERAVLRISNQVIHSEQIDIEHVFDRFYKADVARSKTSTGLGLSIAKELVKRMNGEISAKTEKNEFIIEMRFPLSI